MLLYIVASVFMVVSLVVKIFAMTRLKSSKSTDPNRMQQYVRYNLISYALLAPAVVCVVLILMGS